MKERWHWQVFQAVFTDPKLRIPQKASAQKLKKQPRSPLQSLGPYWQYFHLYILLSSLIQAPHSIPNHIFFFYTRTFSVAPFGTVCLAVVLSTTKADSPETSLHGG